MSPLSPPVMMIGDGDGGGLVVLVVGGGVMAPPSPPYNAPPCPPYNEYLGFPPKLLTASILDSFKYYNFWLAMMAVNGFFSDKSRTKRSRPLSFFEDLWPCTGFEGCIFLGCAQVSYEMLIASFGVSK